MKFGDMGAYMFFACGGLMLLAFVMAMIGAIFSIEKLRKVGMMVMVGSAIFAMVGFGMCLARI